MADTERTLTELLAIFASGQPIGSISPQDMRDYVVTADIVNTRFSIGLITGGVVTSDSPTTVKISAGEGFFADNFTDPLNPVRLKVVWSDFNGVTLPDIATQPATYLGLDLSSGNATVVKKAQIFNADERREFISLAPAIHISGTIESIGAVYSYALDERQSLTDLAFAIGGINLDNGNVYSPNAAADLTIDKSAGSIFFMGTNYQNSQKSPNATIDPVQTPVPSIFYTYQDGSGGFINVLASPINEIDPEQWDDGDGTLAEVPNSLKFSIQRIWSLPLLNITFIHYAQTTYNTMASAQAAINTEAFNKNPGLVSQFRGWLIVEKGTMDLTLTAGTLFVTAGKFGDVLRE